MVTYENAKVILEIAKTGSYQAAADNLGYTHSGVSYIVNALENELGIKFFHRRYGGVTLTKDGEYLMPWIKRVKTNEESIRKRIEEIKNLDSGVMRINCFNSVATNWLPGIIEKFHRDYPYVKLILSFEEHFDESRELIRNEEVECGFLAEPVGKGIESIFLARIPVVAVVGETHPLASKEKIEIEELNNYYYIKSPHNFEAESFLEANKIKPIVSFHADNDLCAMALASKNLGYCIFPKMLLDSVNLPLAGIAFEKELYWDVCLGVKSLKNSTNTLKKFIEYSLQWVNENVEEK